MGDFKGSVLDQEFINKLGKFDIVYSWGVLHHTGNMWEAIKLASSALKNNGVFYIALYSKDTYVQPPYQHWIEVKRNYNLSGPLTRIFMEISYAWKHAGIKQEVRNFRNPLTFMREYKKSRGMSFWHDVKDWLGGYPMEFAGNNETTNFCLNELGLELINQRAGAGNTEYLFRKVGEKNYWTDIETNMNKTELNGPFEHFKGFAWRIKIEVDKNSDPEKFMLLNLAGQLDGRTPI